MKKWIDENGLEIPSSRVSSVEKLMERSANKIVKQATDINKRLRELKQFVESKSLEIYLTIMEEKGIDPTTRKGNYTWYNFDKSIKIEIDVNFNIKFDETLLEACKAKLFQFIDVAIKSEVEFVTELIHDAFSKRDGRLDPKKVLGLLRWRSKVKNKLYHEAMNILEEGYRRVRSKQYNKIWIKNDVGEYEAIDLNFSSIKVKTGVDK